MKRTAFALALVLTLCSTASSGLAADGASTVELSAAYTKSYTEWGGVRPLSGGPGFGIGFWRTASADLSGGIEVFYDDLGDLDRSYMDTSGTPVRSKLEATIVRVNPAFRVHFGRSDGPKFLAQVGAGLYHVNTKYHVVEGLFIFDGENKYNKFGFNVGAGVGLPLGHAKRLNFMGFYHVVNGEEAVSDDFNHLQGRATFGLEF